MTIDKTDTDTLHLNLIKNKRVPRYTSYPTVPHFHDGINSDTVKSWLSALPTKTDTLSLYVHIPFCKKLCTFCGCNMKIINTYSPITHFLGLLKKELSIVKKALHANSETIPPVTHLHFGGGSPSALTGEDFHYLMSLIRENFTFSENAEIAVEIDPRTVDKEKIKAYTEAGMNRMSLGVQDFNEKVQIAVNRVQPYALVKDVIDLLAKYGVSSVNLDIMYGLPHQTMETIVETMNQVLTLSPDRLAVFGYAHVPWIKKHQRLIPEESLPDMETRWEMYSYIKDFLCNNGYIAVGLDHFSKATDIMSDALEQRTLNRNFQGYTTDTADALIGLGQSAIGFYPQGYMQNTVTPSEYEQALKNGNLPISKGIAITDEDRVRRKIIEDIMCYMSVDLKKICNDFNVDMDFSPEFEKLQSYFDTGVVTIEDGFLDIKPEGRVLIRIVASAFDTYLQSEQSKHSSAV